MLPIVCDSVSLLLGLRYTLSRQRSRSVAFISRIAMMGIILGVSLLIVVLSVMNGFDKELRERILRIMPQVTLYHAQGIDDWQGLRQQWIRKEHIQGVSPFVELQGMVNKGKHTEPLLIYGIDQNLEPTTSIIHQFLKHDTLSTLSSDPSTIVLGDDLAKKLGLEDIASQPTVSIIIPRAQGQSVPPAISRLRVVDLLKTGTEIDNSLALMGMSTAAGLSIYPNSISGLHIKVDDLFLAPTIANEIQQQLPYGFYTTDWTRTHGNIYYAIQMSKKLVTLLLLLIIAIAAFNVVSTLIMAVIDKHSDIAILRTLGASNKQVLAVFMVQGTVISVIGTTIGVVLGILMALFVQDFVAFVEATLQVSFLKSDIYPVSYLPSQLLYSDVLLVMLVSLVMSFVATLYPAWRAVKVNPVDALRYD